MSTWDLSRARHHILICNGGSCKKRGGEELAEALRKEIGRRELNNQIHTTRTLCNGRCQDACVVAVYPEGTWYKDLYCHDAKPFIHSLHSNQRYCNKTSLIFEDEGFQRVSDSIAEGIPKLF